MLSTVYVQNFRLPETFGSVLWAADVGKRSASREVVRDIAQSKHKDKTPYQYIAALFRRMPGPKLTKC